MARGKVAPEPSPVRNVCFTEENQLRSENPVSCPAIEDIPKKPLHPVIFGLNVSWMLIGSFQVLFHVYAPRTQGNNKGILVCCLFAYNTVIAIPTFLYLSSWRRLVQQLFLLDTLMAATAVAIVAFYNLMLIFDGPGIWYYKALQICFSLQLIYYVTMIRVMLVCMEWTKWKVIAFKLHLMANALMYLVCGIYFILVDFTYTKHLFKKFDERVHDFMVMFLFGMFSCYYEYYNKISELDYTGTFKYVYKIKNVDENHFQKQQQIRKKRVQSIKSFRIIVQSINEISEPDEQEQSEEEVQRHENLMV